MTDDGATAAAASTQRGAKRAPLLSFGTQVVIDGRAVAAEITNSSELVAKFAAGVLASVEHGTNLEGGTTNLVTGFTAAGGRASNSEVAGVSAVATGGETGVLLHTFTDLSRVNLRLVSALSVPIDSIISEFKRFFEVGRYRSHVSSRYRTFPLEVEQLERFLTGERAYTKLRLDEPLAP